MQAPLSTAQLSHLIGLVYDAAIDPGRWPAAVEDIRIALDFETAALELYELPSSRVLLSLTANIPPDFARRMPEYSTDIIESWGGWDVIRALPMDQPAILSRVNPHVLDFETTSNRYALEWGKPQGLADVIALPLAMDQTGLGSLSFGARAANGVIGANEIDGARLLLPHLQRAATINRLLDVAVLARATFEATLDALTVPVLLTDADLRIVHANPPAKDILAAGDVLRRHDNHLIAANGVSQALATAVTAAADDESAMGRKGLGIPVRGSDGTAAALHVLPLRPGRAPAGYQAVAAIFISQTNAPFVAPTQMIASLFGLTQAEANVFNHIAAGQTTVEAAQALAIAETTVRTHLHHIFDKTGVHRQAELTQLATSLTIPVEQR